MEIELLTILVFGIVIGGWVLLDDMKRWDYGLFNNSNGK